MRNELKLRMRKVIAKSSVQCGSEPWVLTEEDKRTQAYQLRFLLGANISLRNKVLI
jgi:hypothetical protein